MWTPPINRLDFNSIFLITYITATDNTLEKLLLTKEKQLLQKGLVTFSTSGFGIKNLFRSLVLLDLTGRLNKETKRMLD